jgi:hypothetical protein
VPPVAVTLRTTAVAFTGTPFLPPTVSATVAAAPTVPLRTPVPLRVSMTRIGPALCSTEPPLLK